MDRAVNKALDLFIMMKLRDGKEYVARDRLEDLQNDTGWEF